MRRDGEDRLERMEAKKGKFSVKSSYTFLGWERAEAFLSIWNWMVLMKIDFLAWEVS